MAFRILCLLSLLAFSHAGVLPLFDPRIVNGEDAKVGEFPYQVSLQQIDSDFHFCGGSILNDNYVITAAHCVSGKKYYEIQVIAGTIDLTDPKSRHTVTKIIIHKEYDESHSWVNDIALLKVRTPFKVSTTIGHVPLPPKEHVVKPNDVAVVSGWGALWSGGPASDKLQRVNVLIADQEYCKYVYTLTGYDIFLTQVCAYNPSVEKGSCQGDSGGPLTVGGKLVGLVSWARGCASTTYPTVFTRVVTYLDWIQANAKMALRILCLLSLLTFSYAGVLPLFDPRIVNGEDAKVGEFPYQVSLQRKDNGHHFCGGSILNDDYVITASHCVSSKTADEIKVIAGTIDRNDPKSKHDVAKIIMHKDYDRANSWINDIALLRVKTPFKVSSTIGHVPLPPKDFVVNVDDVAVVSGWGALKVGDPTTTKLQRVNVLIADREYCAWKYNSLGYNVHPTQVCAFDPSTPKGSCQGDSGGPLTVRGKLVGLVSWARGCGSTTYPAVFTRVVSYLDWIKANAV
ncbi:PREDICTED: polyserase-2-like [Vollenhovia emeryi]|uniref:polyserase-2-like n=1 Tax=Vollenhovia emeryi TaxID=411798 RepID=UPI0005F3F07A|nr:PREDICTED: polyserase-2-like [Vollenhovia emeryi]